MNKTVPLEIKVTWQGVRDYTTEELDLMNANTRQMEDIEEDRRQKAEAVNTLEGFMYQTRDRLTDDDLERHASKSERANISAMLDQIGEFIEGDEIDDAALAVVKKHLETVQVPWRILERRIKMWRNLPDELKKCRKALSDTADLLVNITVKRMVNETQLEEVLGKLNATRAFLEEKETEWKAQPESEDPVITTTDIQLRCDIAKSSARRLLYAPKRPRVKKTKASTDNDTTTGEQTDDPRKEDL